MRTVVMIGKGGAGKSTSAINLAVVIKHFGLSTGVIDSDPQRSTFGWGFTRGSKDIPIGACGPARLSQLVQKAQKVGFDWLVIDTAPDLAAETIRVIGKADLALILTRPAWFDLDVTARRIELMKSVGARFGVVMNGAPPRREGQDAPLVVEVRDALRDIGGRLWKGQITHRHSIIHAQAAGKGVIETEPDGAAAAEYIKLWRAIRRLLHET